MAIEPNKIIYSMMRVSRFYDKKPVIKDISLSYFYGAKIGVLGLNGSGKSSLLRIMAGVDKEFNGQAVLSPGYTVGYLEQEPRLDETRTVRQIVEERTAHLGESGRLKLAAKVLAELMTAQEFPEFLTLASYDRLD